MVRVANRLIGGIAAVSLAGWSMTCAAGVRASLDRTQTQLNESFGLVLEVDASTSDQPDLSVLRRDFEILNQAQSSNVSIINGDYTATTRWNLDLMAKRAGELIVPAITVGGESSEPIKIRVTQVAPGAPQNADLFLEISVDPGGVYVQQQIVVRVQLFLAVDLNPLELRLTPLAVSSSDAVIEQLGGDVESGRTRGTKRYRVIERTYIIFPQESGTLTIDPATAEARVSKTGFGTFSRSSLMRSRSKAIDIDIKPIPVTFSGKTWLPASKLEIEESWSETPPAFRVGEPSTRTLRIRAYGLTATQLPELSPYMPENLKHYADQPELDDTKSRTGVIGNRTERYAIIPTTGGNFNLPRVEIPWWNTETDTPELAVLPARAIRVSGTAKAPANAQTQEPTDTGGEVERPPAGRPDALPWAWVSLGLALGWLLTVLAWSLKNSRPATPASASTLPDAKAARTALAKACKAHEPQEAKDALLRWSSAVWPARPARSLGDIANRTGGALGSEAKRLSETLYGRQSGNWRGGPLWEAFKEFDAGRKHPVSLEPDLLPPLYRT